MYRLLDELLLLLKSGVMFDQALTALMKNKRYGTVIQIMKHELNQGESYISVLQHCFPWWCPYPFKAMGVSIDMVSFLSSYLAYYNRKKEFLDDCSKRLIYPLVLIAMSLFILILSRWFLWPMIRSMISSDAGWVNDSVINVVAIGVGVVVTACLCWFVLIFNRLIQINVMDAGVLYLSFEQGWSLRFLFDELKFSTTYDLNWQRVSELVIDCASFSRSFGECFYLPAVIISALESYEDRGELSSGFFSVSQMYRQYFYAQLKWQIGMIQLLLYVVIIVSILMILSILYYPLTSFEL